MKVFFLLLTFILAASCNSRVDKGANAEDLTTPIVSASEISFAVVNQHVFAKNCISCHAAPLNKGGVNLETYENALPFIAQIKADVDSGRMPQSPTPPLSQRQKNLVDLWVAQGSPNAAGGPAAPPMAPLTATFASIKANLFRPKCLTCHNPTGHAKDVKLDEPADLFRGQKILVVPGKPEASTLVKVISPGARRPMPPPDKTPLTADEVAQISDWVANGAIDDSAAGDASKFQAIETNIIQPRCTKCHTAEGKAEHIPLDTVNDLTEGGDPLVIAKNAEMSWLVEVLQPGHATMPPAKSGIAPLTPQEWNVIKDWINNGANQ